MFVVQETDFSCSNRVAGGYYADPDQRCQAYHVCLQVSFVIFLSIPDVHSTRLSHLNLTIWLMAEMRILEITQNNFSQGTDSALYPVSFLCPNGTVFNQAVFVCDWW